MKKIFVMSLTSLNLFACMNAANKTSSSKQDSNTGKSPSLEEFIASDENELKSFIAATEQEKSQTLSLKADLPAAVIAWSAAAFAAEAAIAPVLIVNTGDRKMLLPSVKKPRVYDSKRIIHLDVSAFDPNEVERSANLYEALSESEQEKLFAWAKDRIRKNCRRIVSFGDPLSTPVCQENKNHFDTTD